MGKISTLSFYWITEMTSPIAQVNTLTMDWMSHGLASETSMFFSWYRVLKPIIDDYYN